MAIITLRAEYNYIVLIVHHWTILSEKSRVFLPWHLLDAFHWNIMHAVVVLAKLSGNQKQPFLFSLVASTMCNYHATLISAKITWLKQLWVQVTAVSRFIEQVGRAAERIGWAQGKYKKWGPTKWIMWGESGGTTPGNFWDFTCSEVCSVCMS